MTPFAHVLVKLLSRECFNDGNLELDTWSYGTMSPINAHHTGNAIKAEEMAISQATTSDSKASTDIHLAECLEIDEVHAESFEVTKKPSEENWTPVVARRRTFNERLKSTKTNVSISAFHLFL